MRYLSLYLILLFIYLLAYMYSYLARIRNRMICGQTGPALGGAGGL